jgi:hypothetical protein
MYSVRPNDNISVFFSLSLGRLYSLSMLSNLNARHSNEGESRGPSSGGEMGVSSGTAGRSKAQSRTKGIKITSETVTHVDGGRDREMERESGRMEMDDRKVSPAADDPRRVEDLTDSTLPWLTFNRAEA